MLAADADVVVRFQGGNNAAHTLVVDGEKFILRLIPAGALHAGKVCVIGNGLVVDPAARVNEHRIMVRGAFGELEIVLRNNPLATNPKSSELTALSLVRLIEQQGRTVVI